jgi:hypothetical protein
MLMMYLPSTKISRSISYLFPSVDRSNTRVCHVHGSLVGAVLLGALVVMLIDVGVEFSGCDVCQYLLCAWRLLDETRGQ